MAKRKSKSTGKKSDPFRIGPPDKPAPEPVPEAPPEYPPDFPQSVEGIRIDADDAIEIIRGAELDAEQELAEAAMEPDFYVDIGEPGFPCIIRIF